MSDIDFIPTQRGKQQGRFPKTSKNQGVAS